MTSAKNVWVVITSIYPPRDKLQDFENLGWKVVVVGDTKTPEKEYREIQSENLHFLSLDEQAARFPKLSDFIGVNTYARKNFGYLYAAQMGATEIFDTDDDTFIRRDALSYFSGLENLEFYEATLGEFFNPYNYFEPGSGIWPRGFPLRLVANSRNNEIHHVITPIDKTPHFEILQTLVNLEPDVDSIYRMTVSSEPRDFSISGKVVVIKKPLVAPANTQSALWRARDKFEYLYVPNTVSFRFSDILKMYIAQSVATLAYSGFWTEQYRNPHDFMVDFESEVQCFLNVEKVVDLLRESYFEGIAETYSALSKIGVCHENEIRVVEEFSKLMKEILRD